MGGFIDVGIDHMLVSRIIYYVRIFLSDSIANFLASQHKPYKLYFWHQLR